MTGTSRIQEDEVFAAILKLLDDGKPLTHLSLRDELGGRGSGPVLSRFIAHWYELHGKTCSGAVRGELPAKPAADLRTQMLGFVAELSQMPSDAERERLAALDRRESDANERDLLLTTREERVLGDELKLADRERIQEELVANLREAKSELAGQLKEVKQDARRIEAELNERLAAATQDAAQAGGRLAALDALIGPLTARNAEAKLDAESLRAALQQSLASLEQQGILEAELRDKLNEQLRRGQSDVTRLQSEFAARLAERADESARAERELRMELQAMATALAANQAAVDAVAQVRQELKKALRERDEAMERVQELSAALRVFAEKLPARRSTRSDLPPKGSKS